MNANANVNTNVRARRWYPMPEEAPLLARRLTAALAIEYNLVLLFGSLCFSLALASATPLVIALVGEALWLTAATAIPRVRRWVADQSMPAEDRQVHDGLSDELRARAHAVRDSAQAVAHIARRHGPTEAASLGARLQEVQQAFLRLVHADQLLSTSLAGTPVEPLQSEVKRLSDALIGEKDLVAKLELKQALATAGRRVRERERMVDALQATKAQLRTVESTLTRLRSTLASTSPSAMGTAELAELGMQLASCAAVERDAGAALANQNVGRPPAPSLHEL